ncbi:MAG: (Fe-S)-binding protein [Deltaproteobacteria bacterium]|nr:(Fe-S)-binding protein [Deltaproteobacteria bacterium]
MNTAVIQDMLQQHKKRMKLNLAACAGCSLCAESCFLFELHDHDPRYMPSFKVLNSLGKLYRTHGRSTQEQLQGMAEIVWRTCVLCGRCYCPFGIDIPNMIALARDILRAQGIAGVYPHSIGEPDDAQGE